jgi:hypothetical protein
MTPKGNDTMRALLLLAGALALAAVPAQANPCDHNGNGVPPFCNGDGDPPGPGGPPSHHNVTNTNTAISDASASSASSSSATATGGNAYVTVGGEGPLSEQSQYQTQAVDASSAVTVEGSTLNVEGSEINAGADVVVEGDRVDAMEADDLPGIPASVFVDACGNGMAAGFPGGSASFGAGNPVCLWLAIGRAAHDQGDRERADRALGEAEASLRRQRSVSRYLEGVPLIGRLF